MSNEGVGPRNMPSLSQGYREGVNDPALGMAGFLGEATVALRGEYGASEVLRVVVERFDKLREKPIGATQIEWGDPKIATEFALLFSERFLTWKRSGRDEAAERRAEYVLFDLGRFCPDEEVQLGVLMALGRGIQQYKIHDSTRYQSLINTALHMACVSEHESVRAWAVGVGMATLAESSRLNSEEVNRRRQKEILDLVDGEFGDESRRRVIQHLARAAELPTGEFVHPYIVAVFELMNRTLVDNEARARVVEEGSEVLARALVGGQMKGREEMAVAAMLAYATKFCRDQMVREYYKSLWQQWLVDKEE